VGKWLPWDPKPHQVQDQEYAEDQLNTLMKTYKENEESREKFVAEQRLETTKGTKKAVMPEPSEGAGGSSEGWGSMFGGEDLAMQRKKAATTLDVSGALVAPTNVIEND
jgi:hypothetical protein